MSIAPTGYPDFQDLPSWRSNNLLAAGFPTLPVGLTTQGPFATFNYASVGVRVSASLNGITVTLNWWQDQARTLLVAAESWEVNTNTGLLVIVPVKGAYLDVQLNNRAASSQTAQTYVWGVNLQTPVPRYPTGADVIALNNVSVPASTTNNYWRTFLHSGQAMLYLEALDASAKLSVFVQTQDSQLNTLARLFRVTGLTGILNVAFPCPPQIVFLTVTNTDGAAAHSLIAALWSEDN